jgi:hypothetical protein
MSESDLSILIERSLGHLLSDTTFEALLGLQTELRARQSALVAELLASKISREAYLDGVDLILADFARAGRVLLGDDTFLAIFDSFETKGLIDREAFLKGSRSS